MMTDRITLWRVGAVFTRYANLTFGGGSATIAVLHREIVARRAWIDEPRFGLCFALSRLTPGTNVLAFCAGVGWLMRGLPGALVALLAASIPCSVLAILVTIFFDRLSHNPTGALAIHGAMAAAVGITIMTCWTIAKPYVKRDNWLYPTLFVGAAFVLDVALSMPPVQVLLLAAVAGFLLPPGKT